MFKRSRRKIVAAIMSILILLWVGTLSVIYISSYLEMKQRKDGVNVREKFRIGYYNDDLSLILLEKKSKVNGLCLKESAALNKRSEWQPGNKGFCGKHGRGHEIWKQ